eukprot:COSAG02_NODE_4165_length_5680_cov_13.045164_3_plen_114_part_00
MAARPRCLCVSKARPQAITSANADAVVLDCEVWDPKSCGGGRRPRGLRMACSQTTEQKDLCLKDNNMHDPVSNRQMRLSVLALPEQTHSFDPWHAALHRRPPPAPPSHLCCER